MIASGALVILSPLVLGFGFRPTIIAVFLQGAIVNGVKMAISAVNTGGAGDHDKKYNESGALIDENASIDWLRWC
jgi:K(+)-stimulated pyrophosphate-energized sodium pump